MPGATPAAGQEETTTGFLTSPPRESNLLGDLGHALWRPFG
jgi:hypothetical protein